jgi:hypothetical protein
MTCTGQKDHVVEKKRKIEAYFGQVLHGLIISKG